MVIRHAKGRLDVENIRSEIASYFAELGADPDSSLAVDATQLGLSDAALKASRGAPIIQVSSSDDRGLDANYLDVILTFSPLLVEIGGDLWREAILPWIRRRHGLDSVGESRN